jgi:hypothetical protein
MKKITYSLCLLMLIVLSACKKEQPKAIEFEIPYSSNVDIPGSGLTINQPVEFTSSDIPTNANTFLTGNNTSSDNIEAIRYTQFKLTAMAPSGQNLDFIKSVKLYMKAANEADVLVASNENIPTGVTAIDLSLFDVNVKNYLLKDNFKVRIVVTPRAALASGVTAKIGFDQKLKITGKTLIKK